jgi:hypothetical protein
MNFSNVVAATQRLGDCWTHCPAVNKRFEGDYIEESDGTILELDWRDCNRGPQLYQDVEVTLRGSVVWRWDANGEFSKLLPVGAYYLKYCAHGPIAKQSAIDMQP